MIKINNITNKTFKYKFYKNKRVCLGPFSGISNSFIENKVNIDKLSFINRSSVGKYFGLGNFSYIADSIIGSYCTFASRISVAAFNHPINFLSIHEFQYKNLIKAFGETIIKKRNDLQNSLRLKKKTNIGNDVWIGDNAVILKGVRINSGSIIGAGTIVTKDVEPYSVVVGNPAKVIKKRFPDKIISELLKLKWWDLSIKELRDCDFQDIYKSISQIKKIKELKLRK